VKKKKAAAPEKGGKKKTLYTLWKEVKKKSIQEKGGEKRPSFQDRGGIKPPSEGREVSIKITTDLEGKKKKHPLVADKGYRGKKRRHAIGEGEGLAEEGRQKKKKKNAGKKRDVVSPKLGNPLTKRPFLFKWGERRVLLEKGPPLHIKKKRGPRRKKKEGPLL